MEMSNSNSNSSSSKTKKGPATATATRSTVSFSSLAGTRPSCWRSVVTTTRRPFGFGRRRSGCCSATATGADEHVTPATATAMPACASTHGNPLGFGKKVDAHAALVRTLVERNDFYCQECNTHGK